MANVPDSTTVAAGPFPAQSSSASPPLDVPIVPLNPTTASVLVAVAGHPIGRPCPGCCHWILATAADQRVVTMDGRQATQFTVALRYHEWLAYHHHIVTHQGLDRRMQADVS